MKYLNKYIQEKLYIGKGYKASNSIVDSILYNTLIEMYFNEVESPEGHKAGIINFIKTWVKDNVLEDKGVLYYTHPRNITLMVKNKVPNDIIGNMKEPDNNIWPVSTEPQWDTSNIYIGITKPSNTDPAKLKVVYKNIPILVVANEED